VNRPPRVPSYRRHKASGQAIVTLGGKMIYLGRFGSKESRAEYNRIIAEWMARDAASPSPTSRSSAHPDLTIAELAAFYWSHVETYYVRAGKQTSQVHVVRLALEPVRELYGHTKAMDFGPLALKAVRQRLLTNRVIRKLVKGKIEELPRRAVSRATANSLVSRIRQMFQWAASEELLPASVHQSLTTVSGLKRGRTAAREAEPIKPVPDAMVDPVRPHVSRQVWAMIELQRWTAARPGEIVIMRGIDINMAGNVWEYVPGRHKNEFRGSERTIFIGPQAQEILKPWLKPNLQAHLFSPAEAEDERLAEQRENRRTPRYPSHQKYKGKLKRDRDRRSLGDHYSPEAYRRAIARGCDLAFPHPTLSATAKEELSEAQVSELQAWRKLHRFHPNRLRHTAATRIRREYGLEVAQVILGHAKLGTTQVYAEKNLDVARTVMSEIG
jgi:site-specific recombinase XerD